MSVKNLCGHGHQFCLVGCTLAGTPVFRWHSVAFWSVRQQGPHIPMAFRCLLGCTLAGTPVFPWHSGAFWCVHSIPMVFWCLTHHGHLSFAFLVEVYQCFNFVMIVGPVYLSAYIWVSFRNFISQEIWLFSLMFFLLLLLSQPNSG